MPREVWTVCRQSGAADDTQPLLLVETCHLASISVTLVSSTAAIMLRWPDT